MTDDVSLHKAFSEYGEIIDAKVQQDRSTGQSRGFGFVLFKDRSVMEFVVANHSNMVIDGQKVEVKEALPPGACATKSADQQLPKFKVFVGGISAKTTDADLREYFAKFGELLECHIVMNRTNSNVRRFGFVTFSDLSTFNRVLQHPSKHVIDGCVVDCEPSHSRTRNQVDQPPQAPPYHHHHHHHYQQQQPQQLSPSSLISSFAPAPLHMLSPPASPHSMSHSVSPSVSSPANQSVMLQYMQPMMPMHILQYPQPLFSQPPTAQQPMGFAPCLCDFHSSLFLKLMPRLFSCFTIE